MKHILLIGIMLVLGQCEPVFAVQSMQTISTSRFHLKYENGISLQDVKKIGKMFEKSYTDEKKIFNISFSGKMDVLMYTSVNRFKSESQTRAFSDGDYTAGKFFLVIPPKMKGVEGMENIVERLVVRAMLEHIPACPPWFSEAYSLYAGNAVTRFGKPARLTTSSFSDLGEDYVSAEHEKDIVELYAKLGLTIQFLVDRFGKEHVEEAINLCKTNGNIADVFQTVFNEKYSDIEKEWVTALRVQMKQ